MKYMYKYLFMTAISLAMVIAACTNDELSDTSVDDDSDIHTAILILNSSHEGFDDEPQTRAYTEEWEDGSTIYIQFQTSGNTTHGVATYTQATDTWTVTYHGTLTVNAWTSCTLYYFKGTTETSNQTISLTPQTAVYCADNGEYIFSDNTILLNATLRPITGRLRFAMKYDLDSLMNALKDSLTYKQHIYVEKLAMRDSFQRALLQSIDNGADASQISGMATDIKNLTLEIECDSAAMAAIRDDSVKLANSQTFMERENIAVSGFHYYSSYDTKSGKLTADSLVYSKRLNLSITKTTKEWFTPYFYVVEFNPNGEYTYENNFEVRKNEAERWFFFFYRKDIDNGSSLFIPIPLDYNYSYSNNYWDLLTNYSELGRYEVEPSIIIPRGGVGELNISYNFDKPDFFTGYEFDLYLPDGIGCCDGRNFESTYSLGICHGKSHYIDADGFDDNMYFWGCRSSDNETIKGTSGTLLKIKLAADKSLRVGDVLIGYLRFPRLTSSKYGVARFSELSDENIPITIVIGNAADETTPETKEYEVNDVKFIMTKVDGGTFWMGGADYYKGTYNPNTNERPVHKVILDDYWIGRTEVTQELWEAVMGSNPSDHKGTNLPVENVSWDDCQTFITKLNELTGLTFRLPTEAEWEFAAAGGGLSRGYAYAGSNNIDDVAWYYDNSGGETHVVATKYANELGLYDMSGNVGEWCQDWYGSDYYSKSPVNNPLGPASGSYRVIRGGSHGRNSGDCRVAGRNYFSPTSRNSYGGLRLSL